MAFYVQALEINICSVDPEILTTLILIREVDDAQLYGPSLPVEKIALFK